MPHIFSQTKLRAINYSCVEYIDIAFPSLVRYAEHLPPAPWWCRKVWRGLKAFYRKGSEPIYVLMKSQSMSWQSIEAPRTPNKFAQLWLRTLKRETITWIFHKFCDLIY